ncbi:MAG: ABC transporter ATP-binding protein/permease [Oscillospiraceae bacterium]|nr:ABC transporter ATP-binding protein/permease [Oscillospiraceae bacterium]
MILKQKKYGFIDMVVLPVKTSPLFSAIQFVYMVLGGLFPMFTVFITASFLNAAAAVYNGSADMSAVMKPAVFYALMMLYNSGINTVMDLVNCRATIKFRKKLMPLITEKQAKLEYRHMENAETLNLIDRVCPKFSEKVQEMYMHIVKVSSYLSHFLGIIITLYTQVWWIAAIIIVSVFPLIYISSKAGRRSYDADVKMSKVERRAGYLSDVLKNRENVEERAVFGYTGELNKSFRNQYEHSRKYKLKVDLGISLTRSAGNFIMTVFTVFILFMLIIAAMRGEIETAMFIGLIGGVLSLTGGSGLPYISRHAQFFTRHLEYLKDLTAFLALEDCEGAIDLPVENMDFEKIEFQNVSFKYPGTEKLILDGVSFVIEKGRHYSFVGENGAGKTTITKLLTGLYDNYTGEILIDGKNLRTFSQAEIKRTASVVYQDFAKYYISLYDNIAISDLRNYDNDKNHEEVKKALSLVGLDEAAEKLPLGINTPLGKIYEGGVDLSGGEWQRTAMARSVMSNAPLKILDEPTAALDPKIESMVYKNFEQISKGKTTVFISHRLGSTKLSDMIYVLSEGKIAESGSHETLMKKNGIYAEMFNSQAEWYIDNEKGAVDHEEF